MGSANLGRTGLLIAIRSPRSKRSEPILSKGSPEVPIMSRDTTRNLEHRNDDPAHLRCNPADRIIPDNDMAPRAPKRVSRAHSPHRTQCWLEGKRGSAVDLSKTARFSPGSNITR